MSLITIQRSPTPENSEEGVVSDSESNDDLRTASSVGVKSRALSECYFIVRGAAVILSHSDQASISPRSPSQGSNNEIEAHLQAMLRILRSEDTLSMAVRLQSSIENYTKYLAVLSTFEEERDAHESALLGFDFLPSGKAVVGVALPIISSSKVELDGDGGITFCAHNSFWSPYLFKPVSIQSMWSLFQCLHKELSLASQAAKTPLFSGPVNHNWLNYYRAQITTDDSICAQWQFSLVDEAAEGDLKATVEKPQASTSYASVSDKPVKQLEVETQIRTNLKQIMQSVDLDSVTSKDIRNRLEDQLKVQSLSLYKEFIDKEMLVILGQLDKASRIFDYLYLGTEWNASNWEELKASKVEYILNVTKEVDNFFPSQFKYLKIWVSDEATTELLMHWQKTYDFIKEAKDKGSVVLVHCKKGISRSSSTVVAYIMKEYGWPLSTSLNFVKERRDCITPNHGFIEQLKTFHGVLTASSNRHSFRQNAVLNTSAASTSTVNSVMVGGDFHSSRTTRQISSSPSVSESEVFFESSLACGGTTNFGEIDCQDKCIDDVQDPAEKHFGGFTLSRNIALETTIGTSTDKSTNERCSIVVQTQQVEKRPKTMSTRSLPSNTSIEFQKIDTTRQKGFSQPNTARHKSNIAITSAKYFFALKHSTDSGWATKRRASSSLTEIAAQNSGKFNSGRVKQHKENFENRPKQSKGMATSFVSSIAKEIGKLSITAGPQDLNHKHHTVGKDRVCMSISTSIRNKVKTFSNKNSLDVNQQQKRNVKSLVHDFESGLAVRKPASSRNSPMIMKLPGQDVKLRKSFIYEPKYKSPQCNEQLTMDENIPRPYIIAAQTSQS